MEKWHQQIVLISSIQGRMQKIGKIEPDVFENSIYFPKRTGYILKKIFCPEGAPTPS